MTKRRDRLRKEKRNGQGLTDYEKAMTKSLNQAMQQRNAVNYYKGRGA